MERLPFNSLSIPLSAPYPFSTATLTAFYSNYIIQGPTKVNVSFNNLYFDVKPYKVAINWGLNPSEIEYFNLNLSVSSTVMYFNSTNTFYVYYPTTLMNSVTSTVTIYFENNITYKFLIALSILADNVIDQELNILSTQITSKDRRPIFNIESNKYNTVYNVIG